MYRHTLWSHLAQAVALSAGAMELTMGQQLSARKGSVRGLPVRTSPRPIGGPPDGACADSATLSDTGGHVQARMMEPLGPGSCPGCWGHVHGHG